MNPFAELGLPEQFALTRETIDGQYRDLQKIFHPDKNTGLSAAEKRVRSERALTASQAYRVLIDPIARAEALLTATGHSVETAPDEMFLFEMMERREELAAHKKERAWVQDKASELAREISAIEQELGEAFTNGNAQNAATLLSKLKYLRRFLDAAQIALDDLEHNP